MELLPIKYIVIGNILSFSLILIAVLNIILYKKYFNQVKTLVDPSKVYSETGSMFSVIRNWPFSSVISVIVLFVVFVSYIAFFYYGALIWLLFPFFLLLLLLLIVSNIFVFVSIITYMFDIEVRTFFMFVFVVNLATIHLILQGIIITYNNGWLNL